LVIPTGTRKMIEKTRGIRTAWDNFLKEREKRRTERKANGIAIDTGKRRVRTAIKRDDTRNGIDMFPSLCFCVI